MKEKFLPLKRLLVWRKWDKLINMTASQVRQNRENSEAGLTKDQAEEAGAGVLAGREVSKKIEDMIRKADGCRGSLKKVPNWTAEEWKLAGQSVRFLSRFYAVAKTEDLIDDDGEVTPRVESMRNWGMDPLKFRGKIQSTEEIKKEIRAITDKDKKQELKDWVILKANEML